MDELQAKKVLDALAKKMHADSVCICSSYDVIGIPTFILMLEKDNKKYSLYMHSINDEYELWHEIRSYDNTFCNFLNNLKTIKSHVVRY